MIPPGSAEGERNSEGCGANLRPLQAKDGVQGQQEQDYTKAQARGPAAHPYRAVHGLEVGRRPVAEPVVAGLLQGYTQGAGHGGHGLPRIGALGEPGVTRQDAASSAGMSKWTRR